MKNDEKIQSTDGNATAAGTGRKPGIFRWRNVLYALVIPTAVVLMLLLHRYPPEEYHFWPQCIFYNLTGIHCPGCGNTRALCALMRGDLAGCFAKNALFLPMVLCIIATMISPKLGRNRYFSATVAVTVLMFFILRNLPWYPFSLLAPH